MLDIVDEATLTPELAKMSIPIGMERSNRRYSISYMIGSSLAI